MGGFDDYALAGEPAVGPTGAVSWAKHVATGRAVAVTELAPKAASDQAFLRRLRATAAALAKVDHPNVLPIRELVEGDVGDGGGRVWVVEDWLEGRELGEVLGDGRLTAEQSVALTSGVLRGLSAVHAKGVVHGDVSTASIVIAAGGVPRLVGFGFAGMPGRPPADDGSDVLAAASVLRDLLAGGARHPKLEAVVARATSSRPKDRPKNAATLLAMVEKAAKSDFGKGWVAKPSLAQRAFPPPAAGTDEILSAATELLVGLLASEPGPSEEVEAPDDVESDGVGDVDASVADTAVDDAGEADEPAAQPAELEPADPDGDVEPAATVVETAASAAAAEPVVEPTAFGADPAGQAEAAAPAGAEATAEPTGRIAVEPKSPGTVAQPVKAAAAPKARPHPNQKSSTAKSTKARNKKPRTPPPPTAPAVPVASKAAPAPEAAPTPTGRGRKERGRRPPSPPVVRGLAGVIMILIGAALAVTVDRHQTTETSSQPASPRSGGNTTAPLVAEVPTPAQIAASDIVGAWAMRLAVFESTGFFGTQVGQSVEKTYTIRSDCTAAPCVLKLVVSGTPGEFDLRRQPDEYVLTASGPQDCIDLPTGALRVANGGVASVSVHLRPTAASRTPRGDWAATGLSGSVVTTFDTTNPGCPQGSGVQRSTAVGTRQ